MKSLILTVVLLKTMLLGLAWMYFFPSYEPVNSTASVPQPTASPVTKKDDGIDRKTSEPYAGELSIFEEPERDDNLQINRVMDILQISDKKVVADIGAGSGWFTVRAAKRVGEKGRVFAVEINQEYVDHIIKRAKAEKFLNIKTVLGKTDDPLLPKVSVDSVLILKTYHEISEPVRFLKNLKPALRKDALVGIIDRNGNGDDHGIAKQTVIDEAKLAGFSLKEEFDFVKGDGMDYFLVFIVKR